MCSDKVNVLLVDDHPENLLALKAVLDSLGQNLVRASSGIEALKCLLDQDFAVILLDVQMPGIDGFETATLIRQRERSRHTPIIFLTAFSTSDFMMFKGYSLGAVDYLLKPIDPVILNSKIAVFVDLYKKKTEIERQTAQLTLMNADLRQSEERFRSLSACSPVGIFLTTADGQCTYVNPRCQAICGFSLEQGLGQGWLDFVHPDDRPQVVKYWQAYLRDGQTYSCEYRFQLPDGSIHWTHVRASPMVSDQGRLVGHVGTVEDITERKQAEEDRAQIIQEQAARHQAELANRMKDEFLAVLSHELRTPLNAILGWSRLLLTRPFDASTTTRALETIERNARSQAKLVEDILDVSLIIQGKLTLHLRPVDLVALIESAIETFQPLADQKEIQLQFTVLDPTKGDRPQSLDRSAFPSCALLSQLQVSPFQVFADLERLRQVIRNLLSNAVKFTPPGGQVKIALETIDSPAVSSDPQPISPWIQITIADTGIGIKPEFLPYVFDRFRQADSTTTRSFGGLGLGLAIARHLVTLHQGTIQVTSEGEGKGTEFTICLPFSHSTSQPVDFQSLSVSNNSLSGQNPIGLSGGAPLNPMGFCPDAGYETEDNISPNPYSLLQKDTLKGITILLVEDNQDTCDYVTAVLQDVGAIVTSRNSVREAIALLQSTRPDILISDIGMPEEDGYALIHQVKLLEEQKGWQIPAIALTAYAKHEDREKVLAAGFNLYLAKPVEPIALLRGIGTLLRNGQKDGFLPSQRIGER